MYVYVNLSYMPTWQACYVYIPNSVMLPVCLSVCPLNHCSTTSVKALSQASLGDQGFIHLFKFVNAKIFIHLSFSLHVLSKLTGTVVDYHFMQHFSNLLMLLEHMKDTRKYAKDYLFGGLISVCGCCRIIFSYFCGYAI